MQFLQNALPLILSLLIILFVVTIHETGHLCFALLCGVKVKSFQIGLPIPVLTWRVLRREDHQEINFRFKWVKKSFEKYGIKWSIAPLLVIGAVELDEEMFAKVSMFKKIPVLTGGFVFNIVTGALFLALEKYVGSGDMRILYTTFGDALLLGTVLCLGAWFVPVSLPLIIYAAFSGIFDLAGPVGITTELTGTLSRNPGLATLLSELGLISLAVAVTNASFIPVLDGGRIWLLIFDKVFGEKQKIWSRVKEGLVVVSLLLIGIFLVSDVVRGVLR